MKKFEVPFNLDENYADMLLERSPLLQYVEKFYVAAYKDDCLNTRYDITFSDNYPKSFEEYVQRIKSIQRFGLPVCILAQKGATMQMIEKYYALGIRDFTINDDDLASKIQSEFSDIRLTLSVTRAVTFDELKENSFEMYDKIVLFHWFARHLNKLAELPQKDKYIMIVNSGCYYNCKLHDKHWFLKPDTLEEYEEQSKYICALCHGITSEDKQKSSMIEPCDLKYFDPYVSGYKLTDRSFPTEFILDRLYAYGTMAEGESKDEGYYNIED